MKSNLTLKQYTKGMLGIIVFLVMSSSSIADVDTPCTEIKTLPTYLFNPGVYCLKKTMSANLSSGHAIVVVSDDVTIDLNGFTINNKSAGPGTDATGILVNNKSNVIVRNGTLVNFNISVHVSDAGSSSHNVIENVTAISSRTTGMAVSGQSNTVRNSRILMTGEKVGGNDSNAKKYGMTVAGRYAHIENIVISGVKSTLMERVYGIHSSAFESTIRNVFVKNLTGNEIVYGIYLLGGVKSVLHDIQINQLSGSSAFGLYCNIPNSGYYRSTQMFNVATPSYNCANRGDNIVL